MTAKQGRGSWWLALACVDLTLLFLCASVSRIVPVDPLVFRLLLLAASGLALMDRRAAAILLISVPVLGVYWSNGQYSLPLAALAGEAYRWLRRGRPVPRIVPLDAAVALFAVGNLVSVPFALDWRYSLAASTRFLTLVITYFFVSRALAEDDRSQTILRVFAVVGVSSALIGLAQVMMPGLHVGFAFPGPSGIAFPAFRSTGLDENPNTFALTLVLAALVCAEGALDARYRRARWMWVAAVAILVIGIEVSFSRAAFVGLIAGALLLAWLRLPRTRLTLLVVGAALVAVAATTVLTGTVGRVASILDPAQDRSAMDRVYLSRASVRMFRDHPLFGVGTSGFAAAYPSYRDARVDVSPVTDPHQSPFSIPAENGLLGLASEIGVVASLMWGFRGARAGVRDGGVLAFGLPAGLAFVVMSFFGAQHILHVFWIALAASSAFLLSRGSRVRERSEQGTAARRVA